MKRGQRGMDRMQMIALVCVIAQAHEILAKAAEPSTEAGNTGVGVIFGDPTGFTFKRWLSSGMALDGGIAYSAENFFHLYFDHLWHFHGAAARVDPSASSLKLVTPYAGVGVGLFLRTDSSSSHHDTTVAVRIPFGVEWRFEKIGAFGELVPGVGIAPDSYGFLDGGIGIRYYFR